MVRGRKLERNVSKLLEFARLRLSDFAQIHQIEITFHQAAATQDLNLMMSLFADTATVTAGGKAYAGKDQVRTYFSKVAKPLVRSGSRWLIQTMKASKVEGF